MKKTAETEPLLSLENFKWISTPETVENPEPFIKVKHLESKGEKVRIQLSKGNVLTIDHRECFDASDGRLFADMCEMSVLNEPEVLFNVKQRFAKRKIFTKIGETLIVTNPYQIIEQLFDDDCLRKYRNKTLQLGSSKVKNQYVQDPHIYELAGNAYTHMKKSRSKQTIIISGQSGAGKTECTKFCLQFITSFSETKSNESSIQQKILSCNPILEAFGNSKTARNQNSSRFGKYIQIHFDTHDSKTSQGRQMSICGASISSYLLQKSRVVKVEKGQRNYHSFYALTESGASQILKPQKYYYLSQSGCFKANQVKGGKQSFLEINQAFRKIGFSKNQVEHIWTILRSILELGNLQFSDLNHQKNEALPCEILNQAELLATISDILRMETDQLEDVLLFERRKFLKEELKSPYSKAGCHANVDSLSKELYSQIFQFILENINLQIRPKGPQKASDRSTISILDIFGFENFEKNSFEQLCINYSNEKLLSLYNQYVFSKELEILKEDGLDENFADMTPPNNTQILSLLSSKGVSIFSLINDLTPHNQYSDSDILLSLKKLAPQQRKLSFPKHMQNKFVLIHSQSDVSYDIAAFKQKNKDKVSGQIQQIVDRLFPKKYKQKKEGKTLLSKFQVEIDSLMNELQSSNVHFIRCLKPNNQKKPKIIESHYLLNQIRYLGICETIKIRKNLFPLRLTHKEFRLKFGELFQRHQTLQSFIKIKERQIFQSSSDTKVVLGKQRVYLSVEIEQALSLQVQKIKKAKIISVQKIWRQYQVYKFRKTVLRKLKDLKRKNKFLKRLQDRKYHQNEKIAFLKIKGYATWIREQKIKEKKERALLQIKKNETQKKEQMKKRLQLLRERVPKFSNILAKFIVFNKYKSGMAAIRNYQTAQMLEAYKTPAKGSEKLTDYSSSKTKMMRSESVYSMVEEEEKPYERQIVEKKKEKQLSFPKKFVNYDSVQRSENKEEVLFQFNLKVPMYDEKSQEMSLSEFIAENKINNQEKKFSQLNIIESSYANFRTQDIDNATYERMMHFSEEDFTLKYLRKRAKIVLVKSKSFNDIFTAKKKPLQRSLTKLNKENQRISLRIFKQILKCHFDQEMELTLVVIERFLSMCSNSPQQVVNEAYLQLLKQIHSPVLNNCINCHRMMLAFLHFFTPDPIFLEAGLYLLLQRSECHTYSQYEQSYFRVVYQKTYHKCTRYFQTRYVPSKYQLYCLVSKKVFPFQFYLSAGHHTQIYVESDETFKHIKEKILTKLGINIKRIDPRYFGIFQMVSFQGAEMDETPISENELVWDVKSYWEIATTRYTDSQCEPPRFYYFVKLKFPFELHPFDLDGIEIVFEQIFFEYFTGKIRVDEPEMVRLAFLLVRIKKIDIFSTDKFAFGVYPLWAMKQLDSEKLIDRVRTVLKDSFQTASREDHELKYDFIKSLEKCPLAMSTSIPSESELLTESCLLYFIKPRRLYVVEKDKMEILEEYELKKIQEWEVDEEKIVFNVKDDVGVKTKMHIFFTQYAELFSEYLQDIGILTENI